jgi:hypothetical protein
MRRKQFEHSLFSQNTVIAEETLDWYKISPAERFIESQKLWEAFVQLGGSHDPEPDTQSPFYPFKA